LLAPGPFTRTPLPLPRQTRAWLRASAFDAYRALAICRDKAAPISTAQLSARGPGAPLSDPDIPGRLAEIAAAVAPGAC
jgi:hypothetical protein